MLEKLLPFIELLTLIGVIISISALAYQIYKDSRYKKYESLQTLQKLEEKYTRLLNGNDLELQPLDSLWLPIPEEKRQQFQEAKNNYPNSNWSLWDSMQNSEQDRTCYRITRAGLEIMEQVYYAKQHGLISDKEIWQKWLYWMKTWKATNCFVPFVIEELSEWYTPSFIKFFRGLSTDNIKTNCKPK